MANKYTAWASKQSTSGGGNKYVEWTRNYRTNRKRPDDDWVWDDDEERHITPEEDARSLLAQATAAKEAEKKKVQKEAGDRAKETVRKRSVWEKFGDVFEANSPEDIAKRQARGERPKYQDQKAFEKGESDRFKKLDFSKDDIEARRDHYQRRGINIDETLANKQIYDKFKADNKGKSLAKLTLEGKIPEEAKDYEQRRKEVEKIEKEYQKAKKTESGRDNLAETIERRLTRGGGAMIAELPGDLQVLGGTALDVVTPEGSRLDKLAQGTYEAGKARKERTQQQIIDTGYGIGPKDGIVGNLAEGFGNLGSAVALAPILGVPGVAAKGKGIASAVKSFLRPGGVGSVFGASKAGDIVVEARDKGQSDIGALARALPAGYAEGILENFGLGKLFGQKGNVALAFVRQSFIEGTQEALQDTTTSLIRKTYTDVPVDEIISQGIESFLYGAAIGGPAGAIFSVGNNVSEKLQEQGVSPEDADQAGKVVEDSINSKLVEKGTEEAPVTEPVTPTPTETKPEVAPVVAEPTTKPKGTVKPITPKPSVVPEAKTYKVFRGSGDNKDIKTLNSISILGNDKQYYAFDKATASRFGENVESSEVTLNNPIEITNDQQWRDISKKAGNKYPLPTGLSKADTEVWIGNVNKYIQGQGHDGVVVRIAKDADTSLLKDVFGTDQVVPFTPPTQAKPALPKGSAKIPSAPEGVPIKAVGKGQTRVALNTERLNLTPEQRLEVKKLTTKDIPTLTNKSVVARSELAGVDSRGYSQGTTRKILAEELNARKLAVANENQAHALRTAGASESKVSKALGDVWDNAGIARSQRTFHARALQAGNIVADELNTPMQRIFKLLGLADVDKATAVKRFANVDWSKPKDVVGAYRDLVPATATNWIDKYRYTNMLSSPLTHMVNITSNIQGVAGVTPVRKLYEGAIDAARAGITGGPRTRFAGEAGAYFKGVAKSFGQAKKDFMDVMKGNVDLTHPDIASSFNMPLATRGVKGGADKVLSFIPKMMDASDRFSMALVRGGEKRALTLRQSKGVGVKNINELSEIAAEYTMFRRPLGKAEQGHVLQAIDAIPNMVLKWRNSKNPIISQTSRYVLPFINTPTNLFKQGIEYSPLGASTLWGSANKTAQVAKMFMGTTVVSMAGGALAAGGSLTFAEPSDSKQRDAFRAEGKQPYAIKIGNKWIGYSKLHPGISFNMALVGGVKDGLDKGTIDQSGADKILSLGGGMMGFFRDQSYMKSVGDFTNALQGKDGNTFGDSISYQVGNVVNQLVPFKSMVGWINRLIDPTQRKIDSKAGVLDQFAQIVAKDIPALDEIVKPRINPYTGEPIVSDNRLINAFSPARVTNDRGYGNTTGLTVDQRKMMTGLPSADKSQFRQDIMLQKGKDRIADKEKEQFKGTTGSITQLSSGKYYAKVGNGYKTFDNKAEADFGVAKDKFKQSGKVTEVYGDDVFRRQKDGGVQVTSKLEYDYSLGENKLQSAKKNNNVDAWFKQADTQFKNLQQQALGPTLDELEKSNIQEKIDNLLAASAKYKGYGGFTKGRSARGSSRKFARIALPSVNKFRSTSLRAPKISIRTRQPSFRAPKARKLPISKLPSTRKVA